MVFQPTIQGPYIQSALALLKRRGFRITKPRRLVLELLETEKQPLSAYEIKDRLDAYGEAVDTVSVYRILECFEENQLIHRMYGTGKVLKCQLTPEEHCTRHQSDHCHHLLICQSCHQVSEAHCQGVEAMIASLEAETNFRIEEHRLVFYGQCEQCRAHSID